VQANHCHKIEEPREAIGWTDRRGIARHFRVSERTVSNLARRRVLPVIRIGRIVRFSIAACDAAFEAFEIRSVSQGRKAA